MASTARKNAWPMIRGTGGARKARAARGGRGKSGGVIYLLDVYAKSEKEDLTDAERREIRKLAVALVLGVGRLPIACDLARDPEVRLDPQQLGGLGAGLVEAAELGVAGGEPREMRG